VKNIASNLTKILIIQVQLSPSRCNPNISFTKPAKNLAGFTPASRSSWWGKSPTWT
jgi:hypothetical protein